MKVYPKYCMRHPYAKKLAVTQFINFLLKFTFLNFTNILFEILKMIHNFSISIPQILQETYKN